MDQRRLTCLESICLTECSGVTDAGIKELIECSSKLHSVALGGPFSPITDEIYEPMCAMCYSLRNLRLWMNDAAGGWSHTRIEAMLKTHVERRNPMASDFLRSLDELDLSGSRDATSRVLDVFLNRRSGVGPSLRVLRLRECLELTDQSLAPVFLNVANLVTLDLGRCVKLTNLTVRLIGSGRARALRKLHTLDVSGCTRITQEGRNELARILPVVVTDESDGDAADKAIQWYNPPCERPLRPLTAEEEMSGCRSMGRRRVPCSTSFRRPTHLSMSPG